MINVYNLKTTILFILFLACLADDFIQILQPKQTSLWVANGKARRVTFAYNEEEADKWLLELLDNRGEIVHSYPADILFPEKRGGKMIYKKHVIVPETLTGGEHKLRICGWLKDKNKICQESNVFHIEGDQIPSELNILVYVLCWCPFLHFREVVTCNKCTR